MHSHLRVVLKVRVRHERTVLHQRDPPRRHLPCPSTSHATASTGIQRSSARQLVQRTGFCERGWAGTVRAGLGLDGHR